MGKPQYGRIRKGNGNLGAQLRLFVPAEMKIGLMRSANERGTSVSEIARECFSDYLDRWGDMATKKQVGRYARSE